MAKQKALGRPSKFSPRYCGLLVKHMAEGLSFESFSSVIDVSRDTLYEWKKVHASFSDAVKKGRERQLYFYEKMGIFACHAGKEFNATVFIWMTKNMLHWRDARDLQLSGPDGGPIKTENSVVAAIPLKEMKRMADQLMEAEEL